MHGYASRSTWQVWKLQTRAPKLQYRTVWNCESAFNAPQMGPVSGDVCTIGFAQKQKRNARKERHA